MSVASLCSSLLLLMLLLPPSMAFRLPVLGTRLSSSKYVRSVILPRRYAGTVTELPFSKNDERKIAIKSTTDHGFAGDAIFLPFWKPPSEPVDRVRALQTSIPDVNKRLKEIASQVIEDGNFRGAAADKEIIRLFESELGAKYLGLLGLGDNNTSASFSGLGKNIAELSSKVNAKTIGIVIPPNAEQDSLQQLLLGVYEGLYKDLRFKQETETVREDKQKGIKEIQLLGMKKELMNEFPAIEKRVSSIAAGVQFARDLVGAPANCKTPLSIAEEARKIAEMPNMKLTVLAEVSFLLIIVASRSKSSRIGRRSASCWAWAATWACRRDRSFLRSSSTCSTPPRRRPARSRPRSPWWGRA
jgi:hypothetical protein